MKNNFKVITMFLVIVLFGCFLAPTGISAVVIANEDITYNITTTSSNGLEIGIDGQNYGGYLTKTINILAKPKHTFEFATLLESKTKVKINGVELTPVSYDEGSFGVVAKYEVDHASNYTIEVTSTSNIMWVTTVEACQREHLVDPQGNVDALV